MIQSNTLLDNKRMTALLLWFVMGSLLLVEPNEAMDSCSIGNYEIIGSIGGVINKNTRIGKEQKIAMEMAVQDFRASTCFTLNLQLKDYNGNSAAAVSAVMDLMEGTKVQAIIGTLTPQEVCLVSEFYRIPKGTPIISTTTFPPPFPLPQPQAPSFIQMNNDIITRMKCIAAIIGHFRWRKVTSIHEKSNTLSNDSGLITELADSLRQVDSVIEHHSTFPHVSSLSNPGAVIKQELKKLRSNNNRVFILIQSSLEFAQLLFEKAKQMGMMEKGYVWIVSDDIASLLDSVGQSVISNMQGVIGFKANFMELRESIKEFKLKFRKKYGLQHPEEEEHSNPSIHALRAYDATWAIAKAMQNKEPKNLLENILATDFDGMSGEIRFKSGKLAKPPVLRIVNVIGKSYQEIAFWSSECGFTENLLQNDGANMKIGNDLLDSIYWPGTSQTVPKGCIYGIKGKRLRIGVPATGAFNQFVKVSYDRAHNKTNVTGFSVEVFKAVVNELPYDLAYDLVPYNGTYDEMMAQVYNKNLDAAVGDMSIMADRYEYVEFTQPYMESRLIMIVAAKPNTTVGKFRFMKAFKVEMWALLAGVTMLTGFVVWLIEHVDNNPDFEGSSISHCVSRMLWFSITILSFAQRESIKSNLSRIVLVAWLFVVVVVTTGFTAILTSMMTVNEIQPLTINTNAVVGCNGKSFIMKYLVNVLNFKPENVRKINSIEEYPEAFKKGNISAAFLVEPHAKVFLAEYCHGYTIAKPKIKLPGFGFVFPKGSSLTEDVSEAIIKITERGMVQQLEKNMLSHSNCSASSSTSGFDTLTLGPDPFSGLFIVSGSISVVALFITLTRLLHRQVKSLSWVHATLIDRRVSLWAFFLLNRFYTRFGFRFYRRNIVQNNQTNV